MMEQRPPHKENAFMSPSATLTCRYLNSYRPLVKTPEGRAAVRRHGLPPFADGSIRREPDLEHEFPSITCLCRAGKFAPRLEVGDVVGYLTVKARFGLSRPRHRRLTAILAVRHRVCSHEAAAQWYCDRGLPLPSNCMVEDNPPEPLDRSSRCRQGCGSGSEDASLLTWDAEYRARAEAHGTFLVCEPLFRDLSWGAPVVEDRHLVAAFGAVPGTQNPGALEAADFRELLRLIGVPPLA
jgi:hypothetical protein